MAKNYEGIGKCAKSHKIYSQIVNKKPHENIILKSGQTLEAVLKVHERYLKLSESAHEKNNLKGFKIGPKSCVQQRKCKIWVLGGLYSVQKCRELKK